MTQSAQSALISKPTIEEVASDFGDLATVAPVALEVIRLADDEESSLRDLVNVIKADPGLAARLLRLANSAQYGRGDVTSLERAMSLLGMHTVKLITLGFSLAGNKELCGLDADLVWRRSIATSVLAQRLITSVSGSPDDAFIAGLLANVGKLALAGQPSYQQVLDQYGPWATSAQERELLGFSSDELTALILDGWGLPALIGEAIRERDCGPSAPESPISAVLAVTDAAAMLLLAEPDDVIDAYERLTISAAHNLGLNSAQLENLINVVRPNLDEMTSMFDLKSATAVSPGEIMTTARDHLARLSLDVVAALSAANNRNDELADQNNQLAEQAATDALTGLPNRRTYDAYLANQIAGRCRNPRSSFLGVIIFDLDKFKEVNDVHGHLVGDEVLREVGRRVFGVTRNNEIIARIGGEEFSLVLPDTSPDELLLAAERFRKILADDPMETTAGMLAITASFGAAFADDFNHDDRDSLCGRADEALYRSKEKGRNQTTVA